MKPVALASVVLAPLREDDREAHVERFQRLRPDVDEVLYDEIARRRTAATRANRRVSVLLQARDEQGKPLTDVELRDELITLLVAGHETTATTLAWAFDLLLRHPRELERLQSDREQRRRRVPRRRHKGDAEAGGARRIRKLTAPLEVGGHHLPAGIRLAPNIYLTHRRADVIRNRFNPQRFLDRPADTYSWLPFGGGIRRCLRALRTEGRDPDHHPQRHPAARATGRAAAASITFVPANDAMVRVERMHQVTAGTADQAPVAA